MTFYFEDYFVSDPTGLNLVVVNLDLTFDNIDRYKSILKAYMLCMLGDIAPPRTLKFDNLDLSEASRGVTIDERSTILVPKWNIQVEGENFMIHIVGKVNAKNKQIILTFCPLAYRPKDQAKIVKFISKIEDIVKPIIGFKLQL